MSGQTPTYKIHYPLGTDPFDPASDMAALAQSVDAAMGVAAGRLPTDWADIPASDEGYRLVWDDTASTPVDPAAITVTAKTRKAGGLKQAYWSITATTATSGPAGTTGLLIAWPLDGTGYAISTWQSLTGNTPTSALTGISDAGLWLGGLVALAAGQFVTVSAEVELDGPGEST